ncbi:MAG: PP2C family protein-serine/threonine phosphatase [Gallionellaceae bacterium]
MEMTNIIHGATRAHLKILLVDDNDVNLQLLNAVLSKAGHIVKSVRSGEEAIASYQTQLPDLVLMDVMMPGMGGIEATRRIRAMKTPRWVPIMFISALSKRDDMVRGLEAGGDDYLAKPVDIVLLLAKINAMQRIAVLEYKLRVSNQKLQTYRDKSERELDMARELIEQMVFSSSTPLDDVELWLQAAANLGGDLLLTQRYGQGQEYLLLADAMGHSLSAAFPLVPLVQVFSEMTRAGLPVADIVREMNARLSKLLPSGNFVAVTLVSWERDAKMLKIWNGGNPPALLCDSAGEVTKQFGSRHMALGIRQDDEFDASTEVYEWDANSTLTLYSDGLADVENAADEKFGGEGILAALRCADAHQELKRSLIAHLHGVEANDDISLATIKLH